MTATTSRPTRPAVTGAVSTAETSDWRDDAECLDADPELFFPIGLTGPAILQAEAAKRVCRRCPVQAACLSWAIQTGQTHGVWGGMTAQERLGGVRGVGPRSSHVGRHLASHSGAEVILMRARDGLEVGDIADRMGVSVRAVETALRLLLPAEGQEPANGLEEFLLRGESLMVMLRGGVSQKYAAELLGVSEALAGTARMILEQREAARQALTEAVTA